MLRFHWKFSSNARNHFSTTSESGQIKCLCGTFELNSTNPGRYSGMSDEMDGHITIDVTPGTHRLQVKLNRARSNLIDIDIKEGAHENFKTGMNTYRLLMVSSIFIVIMFALYFIVPDGCFQLLFFLLLIVFVSAVWFNQGFPCYIKNES